MAKKYKQIQAGQDWSDPETWYGLACVLVFVGGFVFLSWHFKGWPWT